MPRECLKINESKSKVRQSRAKAVVAKVSTSSSTLTISSNVAELKDMVRALLLHKKNQSSAPTASSTPAPVKAVEPNCVTCDGAHSYKNCPATSGNVYRDNIQKYVSQAAAVNYNQGNTSFRPQMVANQIRPLGFPPVQNNQNNSIGGIILIKIEVEDANLKLLRSLPPTCNTHTMIMRNKSDLDTLSMDDLYNNLKVYEAEIKGQSSSNSNSQNVAFVSLDNTSSTNKAVNTAHNVSAASSQGQASTSTYADDVIDGSQMAGGHAYHEGEEIHKKTGRNLNFNGKETVGFDKTKVYVTTAI
nr:hypothetical protein [Tanacetum cinerariifolium]